MMHQRIQEVVTFLQEQRSGLEQTIAPLSPAVCEVRTTPYAWSVAEIVAHVAIVEGRITEMLRGKVDEARASGLGPDAGTTPVLPSLEVTRLLDRSRKVEASDASQPPVGISLDAARARLDNQRAKLFALIEEVDGLALEKVVAPNAVLGPLNGYQWLLFIGAHEARHVAQIRETVDQLQPA